MAGWFIQSVHDLMDFVKGLLLFNVIMQYKNLIAQCYFKLMSFFGFHFNSSVFLGVYWVLTHFSKETLFLLHFSTEVPSDVRKKKKEKERKRGNAQTKGAQKSMKLNNDPKNEKYINENDINMQ